MDMEFIHIGIFLLQITSTCWHEMPNPLLFETHLYAFSVDFLVFVFFTFLIVTNKHIIWAMFHCSVHDRRAFQTPCRLALGPQGWHPSFLFLLVSQCCPTGHWWTETIWNLTGWKCLSEPCVTWTFLGMWQISSSLACGCAGCLRKMINQIVTFRSYCIRMLSYRFTVTSVTSIRSDISD